MRVPHIIRGEGVIGRADKGGGFNEALEKNMRDIHSKSRRTKKILAWDFYEPYEEDGKEADLKWYLCTFCYAKKTDNTKEGIIGMIQYNKRNASYFRNHVVTAHKRIFSHFVSYMDWRPNIVAGDDASYLEVSVDTPLSRQKIPNYESSCTSAMVFFL